MANPFAALGIQLWIGDGGTSETFFRVTALQDLSGPKDKSDTLEVTTHDAAVINGGDGYKQFIATLQDGGMVAFPIVFNPNDPTHNETPGVAGVNAGGLKWLKNQTLKRNMKIVMPMVSPICRVRFAGLVVEFDHEFKVAGALAGSVNIKVSGKPTLEQGGANSN